VRITLSVAVSRIPSSNRFAGFFWEMGLVSKFGLHLLCERLESVAAELYINLGIESRFIGYIHNNLDTQWHVE